MRSKLHAFTLLEVMIVLVITGLVMMGGYFAYSFAMQRSILFQSAVSGNLSIMHLDMLLTKDFNESTSVSLISATRLVLKNNNKDIVYRFEKDFATREELARIDTFYVVSPKLIGTSLEIDPIYITSLNISLNQENENVVLVYEKTYSPFFLMNYSYDESGRP